MLVTPRQLVTLRLVRRRELSNFLACYAKVIITLTFVLVWMMLLLFWKRFKFQLVIAIFPQPIISWWTSQSGSIPGQSGWSGGQSSFLLDWTTNPSSWSSSVIGQPRSSSKEWHQHSRFVSIRRPHSSIGEWNSSGQSSFTIGWSHSSIEECQSDWSSSFLGQSHSSSKECRSGLSKSTIGRSDPIIGRSYPLSRE